MSDEVFRKVLIYILRNYKIFYQDQMGSFEEYYPEDKYNEEKESIMRKIKIYDYLKDTDSHIYLNHYNQTIYNLAVPYANYEGLLIEEKKKLEKLFDIKTFKIDDNSSMEDIAEELSKIGIDDEFDEEFENTNLSKLKNAMYLDPTKKLEFIKKMKK